MKKKWLSVLALTMCFSMGVSAFAGCGDKGDSSTGGGSQASEQGGGNSEQGGGNSEQGGGNSEQGGNQDEKPLTKDEIYAAVMAALEATDSYKGSFTVEGIMAQTGQETYNSNMKMSVDATNKVAYNKEESEYSAGETTHSDTSYEKVFKESDTYYTYELEDEESTYKRMNAAQVDSMMDNFSMEGIGGVVEGLPAQLTSVDTFNAAFAEVFADSKAAQAAAGSEADGDCVIACTEAGDVLTVTMTLNMEMAMGEMGALDVESEIKVVAEGGYITEMAIKQLMNMTMGEETMENGNEMTYKISYAFDQAGYDAIQTTLPAEVEDMEDGSYGYDKDLATVINGVEGNTAWIYGDDMQSAISSFLTEDWKFNGMNVTWYTDEACTKEFTADITAAEMDALKTLYGKATLKDDYAFLITNYTYNFAEDVTDAYKLVFGMLGMFTIGENKHIEAASGTFGVEEREGAIITVNGEAVEFTEEDNDYKSMPVTAGETYTVKYVITYAKADLNIFAMMMSDM